MNKRKKGVRYAYTGERVPFGVPTSVFEGWNDLRSYGLRWSEQLYRNAPPQVLGWRLGYVAALLFGARERVGKKT